MGWCHEFGPDIAHDCGHPMTAGASHCFCEVCGVRCEGRFAGCKEVWLRGPQDTTLIAPRPQRTDLGVPVEAVDQAESETDHADAMAGLEAVASIAGAIERVPTPTRRSDPDDGPVDSDALIDVLVDRVSARVGESLRDALDLYRGELTG